MVTLDAERRDLGEDDLAEARDGELGRLVRASGPACRRAVRRWSRSAG